MSKSRKKIDDMDKLEKLKKKIKKQKILKSLKQCFSELIFLLYKPFLERIAGPEEKIEGEMKSPLLYLYRFSFF